MVNFIFRRTFYGLSVSRHIHISEGGVKGIRSQGQVRDSYHTKHDNHYVDIQKHQPLNETEVGHCSCAILTCKEYAA